MMPLNEDNGHNAVLECCAASMVRAVANANDSALLCSHMFDTSSALSNDKLLSAFDFYLFALLSA